MPVKEVLFANALPMSTRQIAETSVRFRQKRRRQRLVTYAADVDDDLVGVFDVTNRPGNRHRVVVEAQRSPDTHHDVSLDDHQRWRHTLLDKHVMTASTHNAMELWNTLSKIH